jgi:hypothetical protein
MAANKIVRVPMARFLSSNKILVTCAYVHIVRFGRLWTSGGRKAEYVVTLHRHHTHHTHTHTHEIQTMR